MILDDDRVGALAATKLRGLLRSQRDNGTEPIASAGRATAVVDDCIWVYQPRDGAAVLAAGLVLASRQHLERLVVIVDQVPDDLAFSLAGLDRVEAYLAAGTDLVRVEAEPAPTPPPPAVDHPLLGTLTTAGLDVVPGHAMWLGEIHGLEVARLLEAPSGIQVGVGAFDRAAFDALYPDQSPLDALPGVVDQVLRHRHRGAPPHLLNRLVRERWIRSELCARPELVGLDAASPVAGTSIRPGLHTTVPDAALGTLGNERVLVVTAVGIDPQAVAVAAALSAREQVDRATIVVPHRDLHDALEGASQFLSVPATVVGVDAPWE